MKKRKKSSKKNVATATAGADSKGILICPKCGSTNVEPHAGEGELGIRHGDPLEAYYSMRVCGNCKYIGYFFPEVPKNKLAQIRKEIKVLRKK